MSAGGGAGRKRQISTEAAGEGRKGGTGCRELLPGCVGAVCALLFVLVRRNRLEAWKHTSEY